MTQVSLNFVSMSVSLTLGLGGSRSKVSRVSRNETLKLTQLRESLAVGQKSFGLIFVGA